MRGDRKETALVASGVVYFKPPGACVELFGVRYVKTSGKGFASGLQWDKTLSGEGQ
jgi:hypothetical protein